MNNLIMVEKPYNILRGITQNLDGSVSATVCNEYLFELEGGPIGCAEFGRHIAILGSIALAKFCGCTDKQYYLAIHADLKRRSNCISASPNFELTTYVRSTHKRGGVVYGELRTEEGDLLYSGEVGYQSISQAVFTKLNAKHRVDNKAPLLSSPYRVRKGLQNMQIEGINVNADYGTIMAEDCAGHFKNYPALPVAVIGGLFGELCMPLFKHHHPQYDKVLGTKVIISAKRLAFAGEKVSFEGYMSDKIAEGTHNIIACAKVGDEIIAEAKFELKGVCVEAYSAAEFV